MIEEIRRWLQTNLRIEIREREREINAIPVSYHIA